MGACAPQLKKRDMDTLYKTTIVIWSEYNPEESCMEIDELARAACGGNAYCSKVETVHVEVPERDRDWDGTEFFGEPEDVGF